MALPLWHSEDHAITENHARFKEFTIREYHNGYIRLLCTVYDKSGAEIGCESLWDGNTMYAAFVELSKLLFNATPDKIRGS
jgi:hypothetical protein